MSVILRCLALITFWGKGVFVSWDTLLYYWQDTTLESSAQEPNLYSNGPTAACHWNLSNVIGNTETLHLMSGDGYWKP